MKLVKPHDKNDVLLREQLGRIMKQRGITATDIAGATGITRQTISRFLNHKHNLTSQNICKVANSLGYKVALVEMSEEEKLSYI